MSNGSTLTLTMSRSSSTTGQSSLILAPYRTRRRSSAALIWTLGAEVRPVRAPLVLQTKPNGDIELFQDKDLDPAQPLTFHLGTNAKSHSAENRVRLERGGQRSHSETQSRRYRIHQDKPTKVEAFWWRTATQNLEVQNGNFMIHLHQGGPFGRRKCRPFCIDSSNRKTRCSPKATSPAERQKDLGRYLERQTCEVLCRPGDRQTQASHTPGRGQEPVRTNGPRTSGGRVKTRHRSDRQAGLAVRPESRRP